MKWSQNKEVSGEGVYLPGMKRNQQRPVCEKTDYIIDYFRI